MAFDPDVHHRRSVRLRGYDYSQPGKYFVTLCAQRMDCLFGTVVDGQMRLSSAGGIVQECWGEIPGHIGHLKLDASVVMPNHLHGILVIAESLPAVGARHDVPAQEAWPKPILESFARPASGSLASVIRLFKQAVIRRVTVGARHGVPLRIWQRNYYEHIIRNQDELEKIREYIYTNPLRWACDRYNPDRAVLVQDETGRVVPWEET